MTEQRRRREPSSGPDPYELAVQRAAQGPAPDEDDAPPPLPRLQAGPFRVGPTALLVGVVGLVAVGSLVRFGGSGAPDLPASCTDYGLALSARRVQPGGLLRFTAVGPSGSVVPVVDGAPPQTLPAAALAGCRVSGRFGVQVPPGEHVVTLYRDGRPVASRPLTVTEPGDPDVDG